MELPEFMNVETGKSSTNRESQVDVWNPEDFEGGSFSNSFNTDIKQNAQVDNSFTNNFGDNNVFGAGSNIGNQNSTTMINQNAEGARIAMNGGYANPYGEAKERGQNRIKFSNAMLAG